MRGVSRNNVRMVQERWKEKPEKLIKSQAWKCECCGHLVVLLRTAEWQDKTSENRWAICLVKHWDGNPWYVPGNHRRHERPKMERYFRLKRYVRWRDGPKRDPFFSLD